MIEILILVILSMIVGGAIVQKEGIIGLGILVAGILMLIIGYGGIYGAIFGIAGLVLLFLWFVTQRNKPVNRLYSRKFRVDVANEERKKRDHNEFVELLRHNLHSGLAEKYPEKFSNKVS